MAIEMELRHLRYFVAVADAGSLTVAAARKLHTSQPSLSRQIRDLEDEVGAQLFTRSAHGIELTPAGRAFLDHARLVLSHAEAAAGAAHRIANPANPRFAIGFLTGHELTWMPEALQSDTAPVLRAVIDNYLKRSGVDITPAHEADHLSMGMSLIASTRGVGLLPVYAQKFLASSLTTRPLKGETPTVDLVLGFKKSNRSPILKLLLSRLDELIVRVSNKMQ